jgi:predicted ABC-class ATPase
MPNHEELHNTLLRLDGRSYPAYKDLRGAYDFPHFTLYIDHVQGDPFAAPSRLRIRVPQQHAGYPNDTYQHPSRNQALCTYLAKEFARQAQALQSRRGSGKSGLIEIDTPAQEILSRTCINVTPEWVEARFVVGLPAHGRRIAGHQAAELLCKDIPAIVQAALFYPSNDAVQIQQYTQTNQDADALRAQLAEHNLVAFVAQDSVLPRRSGIDDCPLQEGTVIPFNVPPSLAVQLERPNHGSILGMGVPQGVTLIVGGGFHGKSTLLQALQRGVYNHIPDDGRTFVLTDPNAVKIRAEDGRRVAGVNISPFINALPYGRDTNAFYTDNASGSTSQAANIIEALEAGASTLLIDEDTAATNFMIRDHRMQQLVAKSNEPITPLIDRVQPLYQEHGVSTLIVVGGSGDYFDVADTVINMENYVPHEQTAQAKEIAKAYPTGRRNEGESSLGRITPRIPLAASLDPSKGRRDTSIKTYGLQTIAFGTHQIDLGAVEQLVDASQTRALAAALLYARENYMDGKRTLSEILDAVMEDIAAHGLDILNDRLVSDQAQFRCVELAAALNRLRSLEVKQESS